LLSEINDASELEKKATINMLMTRTAILTSAFGPPRGSVVSPVEETSWSDYVISYPIPVLPFLVHTPLPVVY
jgi:hypothetical protein